MQAATRVNAEQASKRCCGSRPDVKAGKADVLREASDARTAGFRRGIWRWHACTWRSTATREASAVLARDQQPELREEQAGPL
jgi:hypothetical protein